MCGLIRNWKMRNLREEFISSESAKDSIEFNRVFKMFNPNAVLCITNKDCGYKNPYELLKRLLDENERTDPDNPMPALAASEVGSRQLQK